MKKIWPNIKELKEFSRRVSLLATEIILGIAGSVGAIIVFVRLTTEVLEKESTAFDNTVSLFIYQLRTPALTGLMMAITNLGAGYTLVAAILIVIFLTWKHHRKEAYLFAIVLIMGLVINLALKTVIHRPRPSLSPLVAASFSSYPSGHEMNSFVFYFMLAYYFYHFSRRKGLSMVVATGCLGLVILIGFSRVYLGVHYPTDVLAGYLAGSAWFVTAVLIGKSVNFYELFKESKQKNKT